MMPEPFNPMQPNASDPMPETNPLRTLFQEMISNAFQETIGISHREVSLYLADLLTEFARMDRLHRLANEQGMPLRAVAEMLIESTAAAENASFDQERQIHKHIGDFTLFWTGLYPESMRRLRARGVADHLINYVRQGKQSYYIVSTFQHGRYAEDAGLFRLLSEEFELYLFGLSLVRREWDKMMRFPRPPA